MWRKLLILPPILLGVFVVWWFVSQRQPPQTTAPQEEVRNVRIIEAVRADLIPAVSGFGTVQPAKTWQAVVQAAGEVEYKHPRLMRGAIMPAGTEIIRISPRDYELAIAQAEANISRADAQITEFDLTEDNTKASLKIERQSLTIGSASWRGRKNWFAAARHPELRLTRRPVIRWCNARRSRTWRTRLSRYHRNAPRSWSRKNSTRSNWTRPG